MNESFDQNLETIRQELKPANAAFLKRHPGDSELRQPVHTVYGGAQLFKSDTARKMGELALRSLEEYAPDAATLARAVGIPERLAGTVYTRVIEKLKREAVEDFRIDFEDGYGNRPDAEEDGHAASTAREVALGMKNGTLSPFIGIRIKPFSDELVGRSLRTLGIFVSTLLEATGGKLPENFYITIPKVVIPEQVTALHQALLAIESQNGLKAGTLKIELMIETPQSIFLNGQVTLPTLVAAAEGRCTGAHFGTYDYTALCSITAAYQYMAHPACDFAKAVMQVSLAQSGVFISDGATNVMPVAPHKGSSLSTEQVRENCETVYRAWRLCFDHNRHSLKGGFYQGWDLHPAQLPIRYAAIYSFFLESLEPATQRLKAFMEKAAQATLLGDVFDDAATGQGLLNYFLRGLNCGAVTEKEVLATGLTLDEIKLRSFLRILNGRKGK